MIDTNEIGGFISDCKNLDYLLDLRGHVDERIRQLGGAGRRPRQFGPSPVVVTPAAPSDAQPDSVIPDPVDASEVLTHEEGNAIRAEAQRADFDGKRIVAGGQLFVIQELKAEDAKRFAFSIKSPSGGRYIVVEKPGHVLNCDCPDYVKRNKAETGASCKHLIAIRAAYLLPEPQPPAPTPAEPKVEELGVPAPAPAPEGEQRPAE